MSQSNHCFPKILVFFYAQKNKEFKGCLKYTSRNNDDKQIDLKSTKDCLFLCDAIKLIEIEYQSNGDNVLEIKLIEDNKELKHFNINSTILEIYQDDNNNAVSFDFNINNFKDHRMIKGLFKLATTKLNIIKPVDQLMHFLFNIQPDGRFLSQAELLEYSKEFIIYLPKIISKFTINGNDKTQDNSNKMKSEDDKNYFYSEYLFYIYRKLWQSQIFGATSLIFVMYQKSLYDKICIPTNILEKIGKNNYFLPIDLTFSDMEFANDNLDLISENIITCDMAYLAFLAGYQVSLHSKFVETAKDWLETENIKDVINLDHFAKIYCKGIKATLMGREFIEISEENKDKYFQMGESIKADIVIQKFNEFARIFLEGRTEQEVSAAIGKYSDNNYNEKEFISTLKLTKDNK